MRVSFLLSEPDDLHILRAALTEGFAVPLVLTRTAEAAQAMTALPDTPICEGPDDASRPRLIAQRIDVLVALSVPPGPESPLRHPRWSVLARHRSLLPRHRGFDPEWHTVAEGDQAAGVSVILADAPQPDAGPILVQSAIPVDPFDTVRSVLNRLRAIEASVVVEALQRFEGGATFTDPDESRASRHPRPVDPLTRQLDPTRPLAELVDRIRACDPDQAPAWFAWHGHKVGIRLWRPFRPDGSDPESL